MIRRLVLPRLGEWSVKCLRCHFGRFYGGARLNAELAAHRHALHGHPVEIRRNGIAQYTLDPEKEQTPLDYPPY